MRIKKEKRNSELFKFSFAQPRLRIQGKAKRRAEFHIEPNLVANALPIARLWAGAHLLVVLPQKIKQKTRKIRLKCLKLGGFTLYAFPQLNVL